MKRHTELGKYLAGIAADKRMYVDQVAERINRSAYFVEGVFLGSFQPSAALIDELSEGIGMTKEQVRRANELSTISEDNEKPTPFDYVMQVLSSSTSEAQNKAFESFSSSVGCMHEPI